MPRHNKDVMTGKFLKKYIKYAKTRVKVGIISSMPGVNSDSKKKKMARIK